MRTAGWRPLLALIALSPFIGEVVSSNVPATLFVVQPLMIVFAVLTYSVPVVLVRELWVARRLAPSALLVIGLAYGIFNEGLLARTFFLRDHVPIPAFDGYLVVGRLNLSWAVTILVWHSLFSVTTPILVVHALWPGQAQARWLTKGGSITALVLTCVTALLYFRTEGAPPPPAGFFLAFVAAIAALLGVATRLTNAAPEQSPPSWRPLVAGMSFFAFFAGAFVVSGRHMPAAAFVGWTLAVLVAFASQLRRITRIRAGLLLFCIGDCAAYSLFVFVAKLHSSPDGILVTAIAAFGAFFLARLGLRRR